jgi:ribonuclease-3
MICSEKRLDILEEKTGYRFVNRNLLEKALTRFAFGKENNLPDGWNMDHLATLGDAAIDLVVIEHLINSGITEKGKISVTKTNIVNMSVLRKLAEELELKDFVLWGKGEEIQHVWTSGRVLAECMEAFAGAVYLDGGIGSLEEFIKNSGLYSIYSPV